MEQHQFIRARIVVIDDSRTQLTSYRLALEAVGHQVVALEGASGATTVIRFERPDIVLLDLSMPEMDGEQLIAVVRRLGVLPSTQIILHSSEPEEVLQMVAVRSGADGYIKKTSPGRLIKAVDELLRRRQVLDQQS